MTDTAKSLKLPGHFTSGMVLQRGRSIPLYGTDTPGIKISVTLSDERQKTIFETVTVAAQSGAWECTLSPMKEGGPYTLTVSGSGTNCYTDLMCGDVWLCSGQSNMDMPIADWGMVHDYQAILAEAGDSGIRLLDIFNRQALHPLSEAESDGWKACTAEHLRTFSAVAYCYAARLRKKVSVPLGIIVSAVGGTRIETWMPAETLQTLPFQHIDLPYLKRLIMTRSEVERQYLPTVNYNAMIAPLIRFPVKGFLWYQGEANAVDPETYLQLSEVLIAAWREKWGDATLPFLFVQLANYGGEEGVWKDDDWARLREAQEMVLQIPDTGMVTAADLGETNDIHPKRKKEVGERLADLALQMVYGIESPYDIVKAISVRESEAGMVLDIQLGEGLHSTLDDKQDFETVTKDGKVIREKVILHENRIVLPDVKPGQTDWVRYGWSNDPRLSIYNSRGNPLLPFRMQVQ